MSNQYRCSENIEIMELDQEWIVLDTEGFTITKINELGVYILDALKEQKKFEEIVEMIDRHYEVDVDAAREDASAFLEELIRIGLVTHERV